MERNLDGKQLLSALAIFPMLIVILFLPFSSRGQEKIKEENQEMMRVRKNDLKEIISPQKLIKIVEDKQFIGEKITFAFIEMEKRDIIRSLSRMIGQEIVIDPGIKGKVTYRLQQVPWNKAVSLFLADNNLELVYDGKTLRIQQKRGRTAISWKFVLAMIIVLLLALTLLIGLAKKGKFYPQRRHERKRLMADPRAGEYAKRIIYLMEVEKIFRDETLSLETLADKLNLKKYQLSWLINERIKRTFSDLLNHYRVEDAKQEILKSATTGKSILEIIHETGFNTKTAFNRAFKRYTGMTPSQFKNRRSNQ